MRAGIYYRVSSEEQVDGYSLNAQRRALEDFCRERGWAIADRYADEGKSARGDDLGKRPQFARLLADVRARRLDVVVVHKLDRFARNIRVTFEQFETLRRHDVAFVSLAEQMDFSTPIGKVILATLAAFAQYFSDNLATETRKGKAERKAQGLYNGHLPFGVKKNGDGLPVPDPETYPGLLLAFQRCARGDSDRQIAVTLNEGGHRTTGGWGRNPFSKDTVRPMLRNRFYLGELPDGAGGWRPGAHEPLLDDALFAAAQAARERNLSNPDSVPATTPARTYSLSGLARCGHCGGRLHFNTSRQGKARVYCYRDRQAARCAQRSTFLEVYEAQVAEHLALFALPPDYRRQLLAMHAGARQDGDDRAARRRQLEARLARIKELYSWDDMGKAEYVAERDRLRRELVALQDDDTAGALIEATAALLADIRATWAVADQAQRNQLARLLFQEVHLRDHEVAALVPTPEFAPFFHLAGCEEVPDGAEPAGKKADSPNTQGCPETLRGGSDGGRIRACDTPDTSIFPARFPVPAPPVVVEPTPPPLQRRPRLAPALHRVIAERARHESLRDLAVAFEVSHETIRTIVRRTGLGRVAHPGCSSGTREARAPGLVSGGRTAPDRE